MPRHRHRHDPTKTLVGFIVGEVHYALPIDSVREIANPLNLTPLPLAPAAVIGVADYRGQVVPVIAMRERFGLEAAPATRRTKWLVIDVGGRYVALVVDAATEVFGTGGTNVRPAPNLGGGDDARGIAGVTNYRDALVFVLDVPRLRILTEPLAQQGLLSSPPPGHAQAHLSPGSPASPGRGGMS